jgi:hypothetical protein
VKRVGYMSQPSFVIVLFIDFFFRVKRVIQLSIFSTTILTHFWKHSRLTALCAKTVILVSGQTDQPLSRQLSQWRLLANHVGDHSRILYEKQPCWRRMFCYQQLSQQSQHWSFVIIAWCSTLLLSEKVVAILIKGHSVATLRNSSNWGLGQILLSRPH